MAATQTIVPNTEDVLGGRIRSVQVDVTGDAAGYLAGGILISKKGSIGVVTGAFVISSNAAAAKLVARYNAATKKLIVLYPTGGGAASPAALADPAITAGAVAVTSNAANGAADLTPGQGKEVANATNLTTCTWRLMLIGY